LINVVSTFEKLDDPALVKQAALLLENHRGGAAGEGDAGKGAAWGSGNNQALSDTRRIWGSDSAKASAIFRTGALGRESASGGSALLLEGVDPLDELE
jgi:hypothetical protein